MSKKQVKSQPAAEISQGPRLVTVRRTAASPPVKVDSGPFKYTFDETATEWNDVPEPIARMIDGHRGAFKIVDNPAADAEPEVKEKK